ncbi:MAG: hypothetical protein MPJ06_06070, partial [Nitrosopumilus sp.]|nr:hypothetical protein [Nitrosopumilus sp.]
RASSEPAQSQLRASSEPAITEEDTVQNNTLVNRSEPSSDTSINTQSTYTNLFENIINYYRRHIGNFLEV